MTSDLDLLRRFARENSQDAFTEIVRRHVNLVYSAALRQVRSPQLADEVSQSVFADLAREADKLKPETILIAWLYQVARRTAIDVVRKESRRQLREQIAVEMNNMNATTNEWTQIEPLLDDAMAALDETDRAAILLRYFENKTLREVGESLKISDDAAQKRVSRAVERLREFFTKQNVTIGAGGLAVLISANAVQAAPIGLATTISAAAVLAGTAVHTSTIIAATKTIAMTTIQKTIIGATLAVAVGTGIFEAHQNSQLRAQNQNLQQQQNSLADQLAQLQRERDAATNQLAGLLAENVQLKSNPNENELLKLRGEVGMLQQQAKGADQKLAEYLSLDAKFKKNQTDMVNTAKQIGLAMLIFTSDNNGHFPTDFMQITNELGGVEMLSKMNVYDFDFLNMTTNGAVAGFNPNDISKPEHPDMLVLRERRARQSPDSTWNRIYGYLDGRVVIATSYDGNFAAWEKANTYSPPPDQNQ